jgi:hypothetical protein
MFGDNRPVPLGLLMFACLLLACAAEPTIELTRDTPPAIRVSGLSADALSAFAKSNPSNEQWLSLLRVVVASGTDAETASRPAMFGAYRADGGNILFEPRFPLEPGTPYRVTIDGTTLGTTAVTKTILIPKPDAPPAAVTAIYPSADTLPQNTLRLYLHFSGPMTRGHVYEHITLRRDDGVPAVKPFIEIDEELWNPDGTRLTLLFDPGRIKNGLASKDEAGPNLDAGRKYTLTISQDWPDANGRAMKAAFTKTFTVGPVDDTVIDPANWAVTPPRAGTKTPLVVSFPKPLDHAIQQRLITVLGPDGKPVAGTIDITRKETTWAFTPAAPWSAGRYKLDVDTRLEDVCGNRVGSPFEIDVFRPTTRRLEAKTVSRPFVVK